MKTGYLAAGLLAAVMAGAAWGVDKAPAKPAAPSLMGYRRIGVALPGTQLAFVKKGDRVDVLVTFDAAMKGDKLEKFTATVLQDVLVSDVKRPEKTEEKGAIELVVNPNEAQYLALSLMQGVIQVLVRAEGDKEMHPMEMASFRKLFR